MTWLVIYGGFTGIGLFFRRLWGAKQHTFEDVLLSFWVGWAVLLAYLQIWHIYSPVTTTVTIIPLILSLVGWFQARHTAKQLILYLWRYRGFVVIFFGVAAWWMPNAIYGYLNYDDGLYHLQDVQWMTQYSIIPGLGNLHGRLAFNSSHTLLVAFLEGLPLPAASNHVLHGVFFVAFLCHILWAFHHLLHHQSALLEHSLLVLVSPVFMLLSIRYIATIKNDYLILIVGFIIAALILKVSESNEALKPLDIFTFSLIAIASVTIKLSMFVFSGALLLLLLYKLPRWTLYISIPLFMLIIGVWLGRGVIFSGYPIYPIAAAPFPVDWRIPEAQVIGELKWIQSWAREPLGNPDDVLANWDWFKAWLQASLRFRIEFVVPMLMSIIAGAVLIAYSAYVYRRKPMHIPLILWYLPIVAVLNLAYWFYSAPAIRFGWHVFWTLGVSLLLITVTAMNLSRRWVALSIAMLLMVRVVWAARWQEPFLDDFRDPPDAEFTTEVTDYGLAINIPTYRDQCWDIQVPCTPNFNPDLALRDGQNLQSGFIVNPVQIPPER